MLTPFLATPARTFNVLAEIALRQHGGLKAFKFVRDGSLTTDPREFRLMPGIEHRPGLRWSVLDLDAYRGSCPLAERTARWSPHAEIMAAAAHFPEWIRRMNGEDVPYVFMPGYECTILDRHHFHYTLALTRPASWETGPLWLTREYLADHDDRHTVPEYCEASHYRKRSRDWGARHR